LISRANRGDLPFDAMRCCEHVTVVDEHSPAVEAVKVRQSDYPGELVGAGGLPSNDAARLVPVTTS